MAEKSSCLSVVPAPVESVGLDLAPVVSSGFHYLQLRCADSLVAGHQSAKYRDFAADLALLEADQSLDFLASVVVEKAAALVLLADSVSADLRGPDCLNLIYLHLVVESGQPVEFVEAAGASMILDCFGLDDHLVSLAVDSRIDRQHSVGRSGPDYFRFHFRPVVERIYQADCFVRLPVAVASAAAGVPIRLYLV